MADEVDISFFGKKDKDKKKKDTQTPAPAGTKFTGPKISRPTKETEFPTNNESIGTALIFNHTVIKGQANRAGSDKDRKAIKHCLKGFGFNVTVFDDLSFEDLTSELDKASKLDHSKSDCFVVVVMSHGLSGKIYAKDMVYPVERLWQPFLGDKCPALINKPKMFFIQACRGEDLEQPVQFEGFHVMSIIKNVEPEVIRYTVPNSADLLVMYSTMEGHYSWRNPLNGSWFIQALASVFNEYAENGKDAELYELLTAVNRKVAYEYQSNVPNNDLMDEMKEMPNFVSTLTKKFVFRLRKSK